MSHYNYGIINGANESAPKLGAYPVLSLESYDLYHNTPMIEYSRPNVSVKAGPNCC